MSKSPAARMTSGNCITDAQIRAEIPEGDALQGVDRRAQQYIAALHFQRRGIVLRFVWHELRVYAILRLLWLYRHVSSTSSTPTCPSATLAIDTSVRQNPGQPSPPGDPVADTVTSTASHEVSESITDPLVNVKFNNHVAACSQIGP